MSLKLKLDEKGQPVTREGSWLYEDEEGNEQSFLDPLKAHGRNQSLLDEIKKVKASRAKLEEQTKRLSVLAELEVDDDDQLRELVTKGREVLSGTAPKTGDVAEQIKAAREAWGKENERAQAKLKAELETERAKFKERETFLRSKLDAALIDGPGIAAFLAAGGRKESKPLAELALRQFARVIEEDGQIVPRVFDGEEVRYKGGTRQPMTLDDLWEELRETDTYGALFVGKGYNGPQATGSQRHATSGRPNKVDANDRAALRANFDAIGDGDVIVVSS